MIEVINLTLSKGSATLLDNISAQFESGKIHAILGPNGAGKSSLIKCLSKDEASYQGKILWEQEDLSHLSFQKLALKRAVLNQSNQIPFALTVKQILILGQEIQPANHQINLDTLMAQFDLIKLQEHSYLTLSGGEQQRVQLARVVAQLGQNPQSHQWLLLDEWTTGLDLKHIQKISQYFKQLVAQGVGIIMVLHDLNLANQIADQVTLMKQGELLFHGNRENILTADNLASIYDVSIVSHQFLSSDNQKQQFFIV